MMEEEARPSLEVGSDVVTSGLSLHRESDSNLHSHKGASTGHPHVTAETCDRLHGHKHWRRIATAVIGSERLSNIDDSEVVGYVNSREEMKYKKIIWEAMNREHEELQGRQRKRASEAKKGGSATKAAKTDRKMEEDKRLSSKIDYDAMKKLTDELELDTETQRMEGMESASVNDGGSQSDEFGLKKHKPERSNGIEHEHGDDYTGKHDTVWDEDDFFY